MSRNVWLPETSLKWFESASAVQLLRSLAHQKNIWAHTYDSWFYTSTVTTLLAVMTATSTPLVSN